MYHSNYNPEIPEEAKFCLICRFSLKETTKSPYRIAVSPNMDMTPPISGGEKLSFSRLNLLPLLVPEILIKEERASGAVHSWDQEPDPQGKERMGDMRSSRSPVHLVKTEGGIVYGNT
ncbi:MAG: hypothetical protein DRP08_03200 [Candidatus Aenigmatarchaeota archaeon]|nr:MAG: hypothetical protein DRP08_03200 [Candidatus Aenigmarchaeota archaeon]